MIMESYAILLTIPLIGYLILIGLVMDYYGDSEYMAFWKQDPNATNSHLDPPDSYNFTWSEDFRRFEHKKAFWSDEKQSVFCGSYAIGSIVGSVCTSVAFPTLVLRWADVKKGIRTNWKHIVGTTAFFVIFFSVVSFVLTPKAFETEDGAKMQDNVNKLGQVCVFLGAAYIAHRFKPENYPSKLRWIVDSVVPNILVALVALLLFPRTINPWFADPERTELERSLVRTLSIS